MAWLIEKTHFLFRITRILMTLDGPRWREKVSPIPAVPTSAHLRAWQPVAETPPSQGGDACGRPQPGVPGGGSLHAFVFKVLLNRVSVFIGKQKDEGMNSGIRPRFKWRPCFALFLTRVLRSCFTHPGSVYEREEHEERSWRCSQERMETRVQNTWRFS